MRLYQSFMRNATLRSDSFTPTKDCDHEHCVMCGAKFSASPCDLHHGYVTLDNQHWLCPACLNDFRTEYRWTVLPPLSAST